MSIVSNRDARQRDIIPPQRLAACRATVVGVGAIGRQVALQLAAMGIPRLQLIDPDRVEDVNLATQGYFEDDLGHLKVQAMIGICQRMHAGLEIRSHSERFRRSMSIGNVLFCAVDSIQTRSLIWRAVKDRVGFFCDGRMSAEVLRVLTAADAVSREHYPTTLFAAEEAYAGPCTAKGTIYTAGIAAGLMLTQFSRWLRDLPTDADLQLNLLASELAVA